MNGQPDNNFKGYVSAEAKRKCSIWVGVICGVVPVLQIILPYLTMIPMMLMRFGDNYSNRYPSIHKGVVWRDAVWFVSEPYSWNKGKIKPALMKIALTGEKKPVTVSELTGSDPWLLVNGGKLRIVSPSHVGYCDGENVFMDVVPRPLESMSCPFWYEGKPAALEGAGDGIHLVVLEIRGWTRRTQLAPAPDDSDYTVDKYSPVSALNDIYIFHKSGKRLYLRRGLSLTQEQADWELIGKMDYDYYYPTVIDGDPAFFALDRNQLTNEDDLTGIRFRGMTREEIAVYGDAMMHSFAVFPSDEGSFLVLANESSRGLRVFSLKNGVAADIWRGKSKSEFPVMMILWFVAAYGFIFAMPLVMVLLVAWMMRKYRTNDYAFEGRTLRFATLTRRAFAYLVDSLIISIPAIAVWVAVIWNAIRSSMTHEDATAGLIAVLIGFLFTIAILLAGLVVFSYLEGKYGQTPGKRLLRIKVLGTELKPCGFWRAVFRNLLLLADGFWNGLLGIAFIAYTEHWQRVGDLAARTVVVEDPDRS